VKGRLRETPTQTVGPFFAIMLDWPDGPFAVPEGTEGAFWLRGTVYDGAGEPVPDAMIELWQAGRAPKFARCRSDSGGGYGFLTVPPEELPGPQAPHIALSVFARGLIDRLVTRVYFAEEPDDVVFAGVEPAYRDTLIAKRDGDGYRFDIHLQGEHETVFFAI
jgi:protocatechuate 3,4-dioxygenase alpha subunit